VTVIWGVGKATISDSDGQSIILLLSCSSSFFLLCYPLSLHQFYSALFVLRRPLWTNRKKKKRNVLSLISENCLPCAILLSDIPPPLLSPSSRHRRCPSSFFFCYFILRSTTRKFMAFQIVIWRPKGLGTRMSICWMRKKKKGKKNERWWMEFDWVERIRASEKITCIKGSWKVFNMAPAQCVWNVSGYFLVKFKIGDGMRANWSSATLILMIRLSGLSPCPALFNLTQHFPA